MSKKIRWLVHAHIAITLAAEYKSNAQPDETARRKKQIASKQNPTLHTRINAAIQRQRARSAHRGNQIPRSSRSHGQIPTQSALAMARSGHKGSPPPGFRRRGARSNYACLESGAVSKETIMGEKGGGRVLLVGGEEEDGGEEDPPDEGHEPHGGGGERR